MILRLTQKLATKVKADSLKTATQDENPYADWSANLFVADRAQYILLSNTQSLYSTVLFGSGITNDSRFIERALSSLREFMAGDGQEFVYRRFVIPATGTVQFAKALNRSVTGSMNDLIQQAKLWLVDDLSPHDVSIKLNETPLSYLSTGRSDRYGRPREAFQELASRIKP